MEQKLNRKVAKLRSLLESMERVVIAFSGGVDSCLLLAVAAQTLGPENVVAVIAHSPIRAVREYEQAAQFAEKLGIRTTLLHTRELSDEAFVHNPPERCYVCKKMLFSELIKIARSEGILFVIEGSNEDDLTAYRPGARAVQELGVRSPLQEVPFTKNEIRRVSRELGLSTWDKLSESCLASRFPYGEPLVLKRLQMIEAGENVLLERGFRHVRLRYHSNIVRIETAPEEIQRLLDPALRRETVEQLKEIGFRYVALDLQGYRSGSMDEGLEGV